ncbi:molybdopterin-binding protein [Tersicoccus sp. MR15.9]|uniref:molybdopterin-binding protein n=1 Tax=Tersicoccus mangrovi TaxID=3121635 RepID=UPI002FE66B52
MPYTSLAWSRARELAHGSVQPLVPETVPVDRAIGRVLAADVAAVAPVPHVDSAVMDGWAVSGAGPWTVLEADAAPGHTAEDAVLARMRWIRGLTLDEDQAVQVSAGALVPSGTAAVLVRDRGRVDEAGRLTRADHAGEDGPAPGEHVRRAGEEAEPGDVVLTAGTLLSPAHLAWASSCGLDTLAVLRRPRVTLVITGAGLEQHGVPEAGTVRDVLGPHLGSYVEALGGLVIGTHHVGLDDRALLAQLGTDAQDEHQIREATGDVVVTTGGTGTHSRREVRGALAAAGAEILIDGVAVQPGHPLLLARLADGRMLVALPGHPLAAMTGMLTLVEPLLAGLAGADLPRPGHVRLGADLPAGLRTRLIPYTLDDGVALPSPWRAAGMLRGFAEADGVLVCPRDGAETGDVLEELTLPW